MSKSSRERQSHDWETCMHGEITHTHHNTSRGVVRRGCVVCGGLQK